MVHTPLYYYDYYLVGQTYTFYFRLEIQFNLLHLTLDLYVQAGQSSMGSAWLLNMVKMSDGGNTDQFVAVSSCLLVPHERLHS